MPFLAFAQMETNIGPAKVHAVSTRCRIVRFGRRSASRTSLHLMDARRFSESGTVPSVRICPNEHRLNEVARPPYTHTYRRSGCALLGRFRKPLQVQSSSLRKTRSSRQCTRAKHTLTRATFFLRKKEKDPSFPPCNVVTAGWRQLGH